VTGVRCSASCWMRGQAGDNVGLLLRGVEKHEVERGMVLAKRGDHAHTQFESEVYVLTRRKAGGIRRSSRGIGRSFICGRRTDGDGGAARRRGDVIRGTTEDDDRADHADRDGGAAAVCDPRRRRTVGAGVPPRS